MAHLIDRSLGYEDPNEDDYDFCATALWKLHWQSGAFDCASYQKIHPDPSVISECMQVPNKRWAPIGLRFIHRATLKWDGTRIPDAPECRCGQRDRQNVRVLVAPTSKSVGDDSVDRERCKMNLRTAFSLFYSLKSESSIVSRSPIIDEVR